LEVLERIENDVLTVYYISKVRALTTTRDETSNMDGENELD
jgi:hypothetical protein